MAQRLQDTDAFILMQFSTAVAHLKGKPPTPLMQAEVAILGTPFLKQLLNNGHTRNEAASLLRSAFMENILLAKRSLKQLTEA